MAYTDDEVSMFDLRGLTGKWFSPNPAILRGYPEVETALRAAEQNPAAHRALADFLESCDGLSAGELKQLLERAEAAAQRHRLRRTRCTSARPTSAYLEFPGHICESLSGLF